MPRTARIGSVLLVALLTQGCAFFTGNAALLFKTPREVPNKISHPFRDDARLAVLWVGHATTLVQIDDKVILTDPVFTTAIGQFSKRAVEPGIRAEDVPAVDDVLISHMHVDHLSIGSLAMLENRIHRVVVPEGGLTYVPDFRFDEVEMPTWSTFEEGGMRITAVPVRHVGHRYGVDQGWMTKSFTGFVIEYHGITVYFGGDTGYEPKNFEMTAARFPHIDLALLPIGPIEPRWFMEHNHEDPGEALQAFAKLRARWMVPIHHSTFIDSTDALGEPRDALVRVMRERGITGDAVRILEIGEQHVFIPRPSFRASGLLTRDRSPLLKD